jgi:hypothetical protein
MSDTSKQEDWTKAAAMAIPKGGFFKDKVEQGRYGPIFPKTPACYGFSVIAKIIPGREEHLHNHAKVIEKAIADDPATLAILKAHYRLRRSGLRSNKIIAGLPWPSPGTACAHWVWMKLPWPRFPKSSSNEWSPAPRCSATPERIIRTTG